MVGPGIDFVASTSDVSRLSNRVSVRQKVSD